METIENFQNIEYAVLDSLSCDMPQCCMVTVSGRCDQPMVNFSKYCLQHTYGQYHASGKGCKYGLYLGQSLDIYEGIKLPHLEQCKAPIIKGRMYCTKHRNDEERNPDLPRCQHLLQRGERKGQLCGWFAESEDPYLCLPHMKLHRAKIQDNHGSRLRHGRLNLSEMERDEIKIKPQEDTVELPFAQTLLAHEIEMLPLNKIIHQSQKGIVDDTLKFAYDFHQEVNNASIDPIISFDEMSAKLEAEPSLD